MNRLHSECVSLVFAIMWRFQKWEAYGKLAGKELPGTKIARCNQLHEKDLVLGENCESAFDVLFSEHRSDILNGARSFCEASLRHLINRFPLEISYCDVAKSCVSARYLNT